MSKAAVILCLLLASPALAIVVRDDPADHEVAPGSPFAGVGYLSTAGGTTATLIGPDYILTAAHAVGGPLTGQTFTLQLAGGPDVYALAAKHVHPTADLAIVRLDRATALAGYRLYEGAAEVGRTAAVAGFGASGTDAPDPAYPKGTLRVGYNVVDRIAGGYLVTDFDARNGKDALGAALEAMPAGGDSGGPLLIDVAGELHLAGVHLYLTDADQDGLTPELGDRCYHLRVGDYGQWIRQTAPQLPEPGALALLVIGAVGALARKAAKEKP